MTTQEFGRISKRLTREQSLRVFVTANSIDKIVESSREYDSQIWTGKHEIIEDTCCIKRSPEQFILNTAK